MPIRILHIVDNLSRGGLQNGLLTLLTRLDGAKFEHVICSLRELDGNAEHFRQGAQVVCIGKKESGLPVQTFALARLIRRVRPDIVHSRNWSAIEGVPAARCTGVRAVVHSEHGFDSDPNGKQLLRRRLIRRAAFEAADCVLAVSCTLRDIHARHTGFPADRIAVIHNGVDSRRFFPDPAARTRVRRELGVSDDEICIVCVGNLTAVKDYMTVFRALCQTAMAGVPWRLAVAGEGPERSKLEAFAAAQPKFEGRVHFLGRTERAADILNCGDLFVLSSLTEGLSNSILEAMATGLPVLATHTGGNPELVHDGESGLLFPIGDFRVLSERLNLLAQDVPLRRKLGWQALSNVRKDFTVESMVRKYENIYESLGSANSSPRRIFARA